MIASFEDLKVWQKARELADLIYKTTSKFPSSEKYNLTDQSRRCVVSIAANIAEGFSRYYLRESIAFYMIARGSLSELKSHLYLSFDRKYIDKRTLDLCLDRINEIGKMLNGLIKSSKNIRRLSSKS